MVMVLNYWRQVGQVWYKFLQDVINFFSFDSGDRKCAACEIVSENTILQHTDTISNIFLFNLLDIKYQSELKELV